MMRLRVIAISCLALSASAQQPGEDKMNPPSSDKMDHGDKTQAGTSKKTKKAKKSKKAKKADKMDNMDHSKMDHSKMEPAGK